ncbi:MAG: MgtC/SapB family protein [Vicinamibacteria bacterium]
MIDTPLGQALVALLIGLLLGLERERSQRSDEGLFAGIRTFPILSLCGYIAAAAAGKGVPLALPATLLAVAGLAVASYARTAERHSGATTEVVAVLAPLLGALVEWGEAPLAASLAVLVTLLLTLKAPLHRIAGSVTEEEIVSILKFGIVAVVLVPLLPNRAFGPYAAIVPRHVGIVVVTVSAVSLLGYVLVRVLGGRTGWPLAGLLGGLVSSTAVTLSFSRKARALPAIRRPLAAGILLACTVLYLRGLLFTSLFDPPLGLYLAPRLLLLFAVCGAFAAVQMRQQPGEESQAVAIENPAEVGRAVGLGLLFGAILLLSRAAQAELGTQGLWAAGALGGLVDVDSVALAAARLRQQGLASVEAAGGSFLLASLSNTLVKGTLAAVLGGRDLARAVLPAFAAVTVVTVALLVFG